MLIDHFGDSARSLVSAAWSQALAPDPEMSLVEWSDRNRRLAIEASPKPGQWSTDTTPYLRQPMECLSVNDPCWKVTVKKGAQLGLTDVAINFVGMIADICPGPTGIYQPTIELCSQFTKTKLEPAIDATPVLSSKIEDQKSRDGTGSTTRHKRFPGGFWILSGANSSAGLQMYSLRFLVTDELSEWPEDAGGRGDPVDQVQARTHAFEENRKIYQPSTPGIKGICRITAAYEKSDQRKYYVPCPHCGTHQVLQWSRVERMSESRVIYRCRHCDDIIDHHHKTDMLKDNAAGGSAEWIKCYPDRETGEIPSEVLSAQDLTRWRDRDSDGRQPGFWISQLYSPFRSWAAMKQSEEEAEGDVLKEKVFRQQGLGLEWEEKGEAPDTEYLLLKRENYPLGKIPPGGLVLTMGVDVQKNYLQYEVVAFGVGMQSWGVDYGVIEGDTADDDVWNRLDEFIGKRFKAANGSEWPIEAVAIDAGFNTQWVYQFCRNRPAALAVKGVGAPMAPILGTPTPQEVNWKGKKIARGVMLWPVGDWQLKATIYANLRKSAPHDGSEMFPNGYAHFCEAHDQTFFEQMTAEHLVTNVVRGKTRMEWILTPGRKNEALDCRKYAMAAAEHLKLSRLTDAEWLSIADDRGLRASAQFDMDNLWSRPQVKNLIDKPAESSSESASIDANDVGSNDESWLPETRNWL